MIYKAYFSPIPFEHETWLNNTQTLKCFRHSETVSVPVPVAARSNPLVTLYPFLADFLHWRTRRTHRPTTLCRACGHTAHAQYTEM